ncbi:hypothetical protein [Streptomyces sp. NBC_01320]
MDLRRVDVRRVDVRRVVLRVPGSCVRCCGARRIRHGHGRTPPCSYGDSV